MMDIKSPDCLSFTGEFAGTSNVPTAGSGLQGLTNQADSEKRAQCALRSSAARRLESDVAARRGSSHLGRERRPDGLLCPVRVEAAAAVQDGCVTGLSSSRVQVSGKRNQFKRACSRSVAEEERPVRQERAVVR